MPFAHNLTELFCLQSEGYQFSVKPSGIFASCELKELVDSEVKCKFSFEVKLFWVVQKFTA